MKVYVNQIEMDTVIVKKGKWAGFYSDLEELAYTLCNLATSDMEMEIQEEVWERLAVHQQKEIKFKIKGVKLC